MCTTSSRAAPYAIGYGSRGSRPQACMQCEKQDHPCMHARPHMRAAQATHQQQYQPQGPLLGRPLSSRLSRALQWSIGSGEEAQERGWAVGAKKLVLCTYGVLRGRGRASLLCNQCQTNSVRFTNPFHPSLSMRGRAAGHAPGTPLLSKPSQAKPLSRLSQAQVLIQNGVDVCGAGSSQEWQWQAEVHAVPRTGQRCACRVARVRTAWCTAARASSPCMHSNKRQCPRCAAHLKSTRVA